MGVLDSMDDFGVSDVWIGICVQPDNPIKQKIIQRCNFIKFWSLKRISASNNNSASSIGYATQSATFAYVILFKVRGISCSNSGEARRKRQRDAEICACP